MSDQAGGNDVKLSLTEAAAAMGKSERQVRYLIRHGRLSAAKVGGRWMVETAALPLNEAQRRALVSRGKGLREAVDAVLKPVERAQEKAGAKRFSVRDLRAYQTGEPLYRDLVALLGAEDRVSQGLRCALDLLARGCHSFEPRLKAER